MRSDLEHNLAHQLRLWNGKLGSESRALSGDVVLTSESPILHLYDPNGSNRIITLSSIERGRAHFIAHTGTDNTLTIKNASGTTIVVVRAGEIAFVVSSESAWYATAGVFGEAGVDHATGLVPDPGVTSGLVRFLCDDGTWRSVTAEGIVDAYKQITDGTTTAVAAGLTQFKLRSSDSTITIAVTNNDATHGDNANFVVNEAAVDHDALLNFVSNEHIDHTSVSITTDALSGLAGGGTIASTRSLVLSINSLTTATPVLATDSFAFHRVASGVTEKATLSVLNGILDHNALLNYSAARHIDHTAVSIAGGTGLTGGGTIDSNRTISLAINGLSDDTPVAADKLLFYDVSGGDHNLTTIQTVFKTFAVPSNPVDFGAVSGATGTSAEDANWTAIVLAGAATGFVAFPAGSFHIGANRTITSPVRWEGAGPGLTSIVHSQNGDMITFTGVSRARISNLSFTNLSPYTATGSCFVFNDGVGHDSPCGYLEICHNQFYKFRGNAIRVENNSLDSAASGFRIYDNLFLGQYDTPLWCKWFTDFIIRDNAFGGEGGVYADYGSYFYGCEAGRYVGNVHYGHTIAHYAELSNYIRYFENRFEMSQQHGVRIHNCVDVSMNLNHFHSNSEASAGTYDDVNVTSSVMFQFVGNKTYTFDATGASYTRRSLTIDSASTSSVVTGNTLRGFTAGGQGMSVSSFPPNVVWGNTQADVTQPSNVFSWCPNGIGGVVEFIDRIAINLTDLGYSTVRSVIGAATGDIVASYKHLTGASNAKFWDWQVGANILKLRLSADDYVSATDVISITRSGLSVSSITILGATTFSTSLAVGAGSAITSTGPGGTLTALAYTTPAANIVTFLATPSSANLAAAVTDETGTGALVFANTPTLVTPILGTPTSGTLTNCIGLPVSTGISGLGSGVATFLATPTSANLAAAVTDEVGSSKVVFGTSTTFTPRIEFGGADWGQYTTKLGTYTKNGDRVDFELTIVMKTGGSATGNARIGGLPFTLNNSGIPVVFASMFGAMNSPINNFFVVGTQNTTLAPIFKVSGNTYANATDADFTATSEIYVSGTYYV